MTSHCELTRSFPGIEKSEVYLAHYKLVGKIFGSFSILKLLCQTACVNGHCTEWIHVHSRPYGQLSEMNWAMGLSLEFESLGPLVSRRTLHYQFGIIPDCFARFLTFSFFRKGIGRGLCKPAFWWGSDLNMHCTQDGSRFEYLTLRNTFTHSTVDGGAMVVSIFLFRSDRFLKRQKKRAFSWSVRVVVLHIFACERGERSARTANQRNEFKTFRFRIDWPKNQKSIEAKKPMCVILEPNRIETNTIRLASKFAKAFSNFWQG